MKIIGAEIRFGLQGHQQVEAKVIPLDIEVPAVIASQPFRMLEASCTIHTSEGDRTMNLVWTPNGESYQNQVSQEMISAAFEQFRKNIEAGS